MTARERLRRLSRSMWIRGIGGWSVFLAIALFATWPLCLSPSSTISIGLEADATVPLLNVWTVWWNSDRLAAGFRGYWNAPIFYPTTGTFAFSEAQPTMMIVAPVVWLSGSRVLGYNIYFLLIQSLNGWSSQRLLRRIGHHPWLAFCGGVMCQMLPFIWWQSGVVQLTTLFGIIWTVHALLDLFDPGKTFCRTATWDDMASTFRAVTGRAATGGIDVPPGDPVSPAPTANPPLGTNWMASILRGVRLGGAFCVTYLLCNYWGLFLALLLVPSSLWLCNANLFRRQFWIELGLSAFITAAVLGPLAHVQKSLATEHQWTREQGLIRDLSAHPRDFLDTPQTWPARDLSWTPAEEPDSEAEAAAVAVSTVAWSLFPQLDSPEEGRGDVWPLGAGTLKTAAAVVGLLAALVTRGRRRWGLFAATFAAVAFGLSQGPTVWIAPWVPGLSGLCPFELLQRHVPGFALIRSPFRFTLFVQLGIVWLVVEALDLLNPGRWRLPSVAPRRFRWCAWGPLILAGVLLVAEVWPPRQSLFTCPSATAAPAWILWLRENSSPGDALICLPFPTGYTAGDYEETALWMYWGTLHRRPIVNGYSGFFPKHFVDLKENLSKYFYDAEKPVPPQLKRYPWDSFGLKDVNLCGARFAVVKRSFATQDDVWQHPITKFRWSWVAGDEQQQLDVYEILPPDPD